MSALLEENFLVFAGTQIKLTPRRLDTQQACKHFLFLDVLEQTKGNNRHLSWKASPDIPNIYPSLCVNSLWQTNINILKHQKWYMNSMIGTHKDRSICRINKLGVLSFLCYTTCNLYKTNDKCWITKLAWWCSTYVNLYSHLVLYQPHQ